MKHAASLEAWDKRYLWHPFTQHAEWSSRPALIIQKAKGVYLYDQKRRKLLDGNSSLWVNVFGHQKKELDQAVRDQLGRVAHATFLGLSHEPAIRLARALTEMAPRGLSRVFYSDNGSTSVEVAIKMAYQYWQLRGEKKKNRFVSLRDGYHGDTIGSVSVGGVDLFHQRFSKLLFKGFSVTPGDFEGTARLIQKHHRSLAGFVLEPLVQGASGMLLMPKGYLRHVAQLCRRYNVLLIVDEVATGFGRTGTMFAVEQENVQPDFLCVAKSLTGGYLPLAATLAREKIFRAFLGRYDEFKTFFHGHTYTANPLACAVALKTLELYKKEAVLKNVEQRSRQLRQALEPLMNHPHVKAIRQIGLMCGIELVRNKKTGQSYSAGARMGLRVCDEAIKRGVWLRPLGDVIVLLPPLVISSSEMSFLMQVVTESVIAATSVKR